MPVKMPTAISAKWWTASVPASLPKSKIVEAELKKAEKITVKIATDAVAAASAKGLDKAKVSAALAKFVPRYPELLDELKKFQVLANKDKDGHKDFVKGVDAMIALIKPQREAITKAMDAAMAQNDMKDARGGSSMSQLENRAKTAEVALKKIAVTLKSVANGVAGLADAEGLEKAIGRNRFIGGAIKSESGGLKKLVDALKDELKDAKNSKLKTQVDTVLAGLKAEAPNALANDKALVKKAVEVLGEKDGKKLFLGAKPVPVGLT